MTTIVLLHPPTSLATRTEMSSAPTELVEVVDEERIVERGTGQINWFVRKNDGWVHVTEWPGARSQRLDAGAGTVWQSRTEIEVPRGTRMMRVESRPSNASTAR